MRVRDITLCEVGPRDGLQNEDVVLAPAVRGELVGRLGDCGFPRIEFGSFVRADKVPAMAHPEKVLAAVGRLRDDLELTALVLNRRGAERALGLGIRRLNYAMVVTETFNQRNQRATVAQSLAAFEDITELADKNDVACTATIGAAFGCPFEGRVEPGAVTTLAGSLVDAGADELVLADTIGVGVPAQVTGLVGAVREVVGTARIGLHLHDTRNTGVANAIAGVEAGVELLDASVGGAGGCPFAPNATGNVPTEDVVYALHNSGIRTGVDIDRLIETAHWLEGQLGRQLPGKVKQAGARPLEVGTS